jgi:hypothetical protein
LVLQNGPQAWGCLLCPHLHGEQGKVSDRERRAHQTEVRRI